MPSIGGYELTTKRLACAGLIVAGLVVAYFAFKKGGFLRKDGFHSGTGTCPCGCAGVCSCGVGCPCQSNGTCGTSSSGAEWGASSGPMQT